MEIGCVDCMHGCVWHRKKPEIPDACGVEQAGLGEGGLGSGAGGDRGSSKIRVGVLAAGDRATLLHHTTLRGHVRFKVILGAPNAQSNLDVLPRSINLSTIATIIAGAEANILRAERHGNGAIRRDAEAVRGSLGPGEGPAAAETAAIRFRSCTLLWWPLKDVDERIAPGLIANVTDHCRALGPVRRTVERLRDLFVTDSRDDARELGGRGTPITLNTCSKKNLAITTRGKQTRIGYAPRLRLNSSIVCE